MELSPEESDALRDADSSARVLARGRLSPTELQAELTRNGEAHRQAHYTTLCRLKESQAVLVDAYFREAVVNPISGVSGTFPVEHPSLDSPLYQSVEQDARIAVLLLYEQQGLQLLPNTFDVHPETGRLQEEASMRAYLDSQIVTPQNQDQCMRAYTAAMADNECVFTCASCGQRGHRCDVEVSMVALPQLAVFKLPPAKEASYLRLSDKAKVSNCFKLYIIF